MVASDTVSGQVYHKRASAVIRAVGAAMLVIASQHGCVAAGSGVPSTADAAAWRQLGAAVWRFGAEGVEAGPSSETAYLVSRRAFADFRLTLVFRVDGDTNSGVFIRCGKPRTAGDVNPATCYEINIWDDHPNQAFRTGSIVRYVSPSVRVDTTGRWNTYVIDANGPTITVTLNGKQTAMLVDETRRSGFIALQYASGGRLEFRDLELVVY